MEDTLKLINMTTVSIHQPLYIPWLGFFDKIKQSDIFIILDDAQFDKSDFIHRNRIRIPQGKKWLTIPVDKHHIPINQIRIKNSLLTKKGKKWYDDHWNNIKDNYKDARFFEAFENQVSELYQEEYDVLSEFNSNCILKLTKMFDINTKIIYSSKFNFDSKSSQKLLDLVQAVDGTKYISGALGINYLDTKIFKEQNIEVEFQSFNHPVYEQRYEGFESSCSSIDALFNLGKLPI